MIQTFRIARCMSTLRANIPCRSHLTAVRACWYCVLVFIQTSCCNEHSRSAFHLFNMVFVVILLSKRFVIVPDNWLQNPSVSEETKVFFSPVQNAQPNFELATKFLFNKDASNVYKGYVVKHFGKYSSSITCFESV